jgi:hypothetical protein
LIWFEDLNPGYFQGFFIVTQDELTVFVGGLPFSTSWEPSLGTDWRSDRSDRFFRPCPGEEQIKKDFEECGPIARCDFMVLPFFLQKCRKTISKMWCSAT